MHDQQAPLGQGAREVFHQLVHKPWRFLAWQKADSLQDGGNMRRVSRLGFQNNFGRLPAYIFEYLLSSLAAFSD